MNAPMSTLGPVFLSLKDAPSLIERIWPAQKISVEVQKERKAGSGQTLTALGSYWKGRKPLLLVRACVLGALLPSTGDDQKDIEIFESLMGMSDDQVAVRLKTGLSVEDVIKYGSAEERSLLLEDAADGLSRFRDVRSDRKLDLFGHILTRMPYSARVDKLFRPEELQIEVVTEAHFDKINLHLGTSARTVTQLIEQLGVMRFGHRPVVADTFCGGGSIPFEAARLGCDVLASDLNPIACMLTWGALNIVGAAQQTHQEIVRLQKIASLEFEAQVAKLGIDNDEEGNRAKSFLYCLEARCPSTGWLVPLAPSWVISNGRNVIVKLIPDHANKRFEFKVIANASQAEMVAADLGTIQSGKLVYHLDGETYSTPIRDIRGDQRLSNGRTVNSLRAWEQHDISPHENDVFHERLYCVQWIRPKRAGATRAETFFAAPTKFDIKREAWIEAYVSQHIVEWQASGLVANLQIETGKENEGPIRTNGWAYWHQMFSPRQILYHALIRGLAVDQPFMSLISAKCLDYCNKSSQWRPRGEYPEQLFSGPSLKTMFNWASRASISLKDTIATPISTAPIHGNFEVKTSSANQINRVADFYVTDPPYADSVRYEEITEFFIAWLRKVDVKPFKDWVWDSRRPLAVKGNGEDFRKAMVDAYTAMANYMPDNGLQIVMFTHQDAGVWADMAQIFWGSGLQVKAAWYIATETTSELKKGGYVQGTVILVLRKRMEAENGYKDEVVQEVRAEVAEQIDTMAGLNQDLKGHGRIENLFEDADLQMAGYAAALRVLTRYTKIDGVDMTKEALRPRLKGERGIVADIIDFAVQVANEHMVPEAMSPKLWGKLTGSERFYFKMMDVETTGSKKLDNYQNFAKAFRVADYDALMGSTKPNEARLKRSKDLKKGGFEVNEFGQSSTRAVLFALFELQAEVDGDLVLTHLKDLVPDYLTVREDIIAITDYIGRKREGIDEGEHRAASILYGLIRNERLG